MGSDKQSDVGCSLPPRPPVGWVGCYRGPSFFLANMRWYMGYAHHFLSWMHIFAGTLAGSFSNSELEAMQFLMIGSVPSQKWKVAHTVGWMKSCTTKRMVETSWKPIHHAMFTTYPLVQDFATVHSMICFRGWLMYL